jgi:glucose/mannose transport system substrate-binding protein
MKSLPLALAAIAFTAGVASANAETLIIQHNFISPGELKAINDLKAKYEETGDTWDNLVIPHDSGAEASLASVLTGGNPPDVFFWPEPALFRDIKNQGRQVDLKEYFATPKGKAAFDAMPEFLKDFAKVDGDLVRVPNSLHVDGVICYNLKVAADAGVDPQAWKSFDDFVADYDKVQKKGYIPFAFGADHFQIGYLFHSLAADVAGGIYDNIFGTKPVRESLDTPEMRELLKLVRTLQQHTDPGATGRPWNEATNMVISGRALFQIQGDWMTGEWRAAGKVEGKDYSCMTFPGAKGIAVTVNNWGLIKSDDPNKLPAQYRFLDANFDPALQLQFNLDKGSTPVRLDVDTGTLPAWSKTALSLMNKPSFVHLTPLATIDQDWSRGLIDVVNDYWVHPDMTPDQAIEAMQAAYDQVFQ